MKQYEWRGLLTTPRCGRPGVPWSSWRAACPWDSWGRRRAGTSPSYSRHTENIKKIWNLEYYLHCFYLDVPQNPNQILVQCCVTKLLILGSRVSRRIFFLCRNHQVFLFEYCVFHSSSSHHTAPFFYLCQSHYTQGCATEIWMTSLRKIIDFKKAAGPWVYREREGCRIQRLFTLYTFTVHIPVSTFFSF
jgi:hypothetical protein